MSVCLWYVVVFVMLRECGGFCVREYVRVWCTCAVLVACLCCVHCVVCVWVCLCVWCVWCVCVCVFVVCVRV